MSKPDKTLIILTPGFPKDEADSTCLPLQQQLVRAIKRNYPDIHIIILTFQYPYIKKEYGWFDNIVISFDGQNKGGISRLLLRQHIYRSLKKIYERHDIIGLLSFWYGECAAVGNHFANKYALKHFCWILGQDAKKENKYPKRIKLEANCLVALSDFLQNEFEKNHGLTPARLVPPGIDTSLYNQNEKSKDIDIIGAGSLIPLKQYNIFIDIIAKIKLKIPGVKTVLIGDGPEKEKLQSLISNYDLESNITLTGELPYTEVLQMMQRAKLFLHPSSYEGFSGVCLEALYAGCHVISFCNAMNKTIEQWHIVSSKKEMIEKTFHLLESSSTTFKPVLFSSADDLAEKIVKLFFQN